MYVLQTGPGCSKLTTLLVNFSLKFHTLMYQICQYFLLKKCEKLFIFSSPGQSPGKAIILPPVLALASALAKSLMLKFFM